jgi:hypothetical protein
MVHLVLQNLIFLFDDRKSILFVAENLCEVPELAQYLRRVIRFPVASMLERRCILDNITIAITIMI